jgi:glycosyltransferase involved in cell wall biosynthesis
MSTLENNIRLTIITSSYNSESSILATINSILNQDIEDIEYIIVDGGSTDKTLSIVENMSSKFIDKGWDFKWISEKDSGIYNAWNKGVMMATGDWVAFLGSDDVYCSGALKLYKAQIIKNIQFDFITAKAKIIVNGYIQREFGVNFYWSQFKREMKILHAGGFLNVNYIKTHGMFDESYRITGDYEMLLRKGERLKVAFIDDFLVEMDGGGVSNVMVKSSLKEAKRAKITTNARSYFLASIDYYFVLLKIKIKSFL